MTLTNPFAFSTNLNILAQFGVFVVGVFVVGASDVGIFVVGMFVVGIFVVVQED